MNKRERKSTLKDIVKAVDNAIASIEGSASNILGKAEKKIEELSWFLEENCIMPSSFDAENMVIEIIIDYFDNDSEIIEIRDMIDSFKEEVYEYIQEMSEGEKREEWEEFYANIEYVDSVIDIEEQEIDSVDGFLESMRQLKDELESQI